MASPCDAPWPPGVEAITSVALDNVEQEIGIRAPTALTRFAERMRQMGTLTRACVRRRQDSLHTWVRVFVSKHIAAQRVRVKQNNVCVGVWESVGQRRSTWIVWFNLLRRHQHDVPLHVWSMPPSACAFSFFKGDATG